MNSRVQQGRAFAVPAQIPPATSRYPPSSRGRASARGGAISATASGRMRGARESADGRARNWGRRARGVRAPAGGRGGWLVAVVARQAHGAPWAAHGRGEARRHLLVWTVRGMGGGGGCSAPGCARARAPGRVRSRGRRGAGSGDVAAHSHAGGRAGGQGVAKGGAGGRIDEGRSAEPAGERFGAHARKRRVADSSAPLARAPRAARRTRARTRARGMATIAAAAARRVTANRPRPAARGPRRARAAASEGLGKVVSDDGNVSMLSSADDFDKAIAAAGDKLVVVDVATTTCAPCKTIYPKVVALSKEFEEVVFLKINGASRRALRATRPRQREPARAAGTRRRRALC